MTGLVPRGTGCVALCHLQLLTAAVAMSLATANYTYNISPTCLGNETQCLTLSRIADKTNKYFTSNTTLVFLPGDHNLDGEIVSVASISGLTLMSYNGPGLSVPKIICGSSSFSFASVSELQIVSINFISCRLKLSSTIANFQFSCFENSMAAMYKGSNIHFLGNSRFIGNGVNTLGGTVFVDSSNLTFSGNSSFIGNTADKGGAVRVRRYSVVTFTGICSFVNNSADYGGAVHSLRGNTLRFDGNTTFLGNVARYNGGAVYSLRGNTLRFDGNTTFLGNVARYNGGAVHSLRGNTLRFDGNTTFLGNVARYNGGAVHSLRGNTLWFGGNSTFLGNVARDNGGAVHSLRQNTLRFDGNSTFLGNVARDNGGAMHSLRGNTLWFGGNSTFLGNVARDNGGAVHSLRQNTLRFDGNSTFLGNVAKYSGGAVHSLHGNTLRFDGNSTFLGNVAKYNGGAVHSLHGNTLRFDGNSTFLGNVARYNGGAVHSLHGNTLRFDGNSTFLGNVAKYNGGAMYAHKRNTLSFNGSSNFFANVADRFGGAVLVKSNNIVSFDGNSNFVTNEARWYYGGAVLVESNNIVSFDGNSNFVANMAGRFGGAVLVKSNNIVSFDGNSNFVTNEARWYYGGAVLVESNNIVSFDGNSNFVANMAGTSGGAVLVVSNNTVSFDGNSTFDTNVAHYGGAVLVESNNTVSFDGNSNFVANMARSGGAVLIESNNTVSFDENSTFDTNLANWHYGSAVLIESSNTVNFDGNCNFVGNKAYSRGAVSVETNNIVSFNGNSNFVGNKAGRFGGALSVLSTNTLKFNGSNSFSDNRALLGGGAVISINNNTLSFDGNSSFIGNQAKTMGGAALFLKSAVIFDGISYFTGNVAVLGGGIGVEGDSNVKISGNTKFSRNQATYGGAIYAKGGKVLFNSSALFRRNSAMHMHSGYGGAIHAINSEINLEGNYIFSENIAIFGGGLALSGLENRIIILQPGTNISFEGNVAYGRGGALHIEDNPFTYCSFDNRLNGTIEELCFLQTVERNCNLQYNNYYNKGGSIRRDISLNFLNNTATESGDAVYGGNLKYCRVCAAYKGYVLGTAAFKELTAVSSLSGLKIASDPFKVCLCEHNVPNCSQNFTTFKNFPGQDLSVHVVAVGQLDGVVPSVIRAVPEGLRFSSEYITQQTEKSNKCTELRYPLVRSSTDVTATLKLYSHEPCSTSGYPFTASITFLPCPTGFSLSDQGICSCEGKLEQYTQDCDIQNQTISRHEGSSFWVGVDHDTTSSAEGLILHPHCPFDYCTDEKVEFSLNNTDTQCRNRRSGVLCGACQSGYSLALGSTRCIRGCSNNFLALLLPFAAAGLALVIFLFSCNLTVAEGTISGLILYANVLVIDQSLFFPSGDRSIFTNVPRVFIAWLNLDLGIETCFFKDSDIYSITLLQFAFPFYIWVLVGLTIYLADISTTVAKLIGGANPVAVLATLFLLSYTKLLRTIMAAFSFTTLSYPKDETKVVWLYDGNIGYWDGKHVALLLVSLLVFLIFFLPYTLFLLCGQWIQRKLQLRWISPAKQLYMKTFFDAHYAPYKDNHRYWTGLLLLVRFLILLLSTIINIGKPQDPHTNLLVMIVVLSVLLAWVSRGVYKKWYLDALEASFIFNLIVLAVGTYQVRLSGGSQAALVYTSVGIAFVTFLGIVCGAMVPKTRVGKSIAHQIKTLSHPEQRACDGHQEDPTVRPFTPAVTVSNVEIDLRQPCQLAESTSYRESVIELMTS